MQIFHTIFDRLIDLENIFLSWNEFRKGKTKKVDVQIFERRLEDNIFQLAEELAAEIYHHGHYQTFHIRDPKPRVISKALVRDRLVHHLVFHELYQIFNSTFIYHSYSSQLGKGTHLAVSNLARAARFLSRNYTRPIYALKCDIKQFFASVPHQKLWQLIKNKINDTQLLWLTEEIINSFSSGINSSGGGAYRKTI